MLLLQTNRIPDTYDERDVSAAATQRDNGHNRITNSICRNKRNSVRNASPLSRARGRAGSHWYRRVLRVASHGRIVIIPSARAYPFEFLNRISRILSTRNLTDNYFHTNAQHGVFLRGAGVSGINLLPMCVDVWDVSFVTSDTSFMIYEVFVFIALLLPNKNLNRTIPSEMSKKQLVYVIY